MEKSELSPRLELSERRAAAAAVSRGTSSDVIHRLAVDLAVGLGTGGELLEFGAGTGALVTTLSQLGRYSRLVGADIMARPETLDPAIGWIVQDLNDPLPLPDASFDTIISTEVIEHLENPRALFREFFRLLRGGGTLILTTPNQESIRSYCGLVMGGHFTAFLGPSYPAHITALVRLDIRRICRESGFAEPVFHYTNAGGIPKFPGIPWQRISFNRLRGRLFSDNIAAVAKKPER